MATDPADMCTVDDVKSALEPSITTTTRDVLIQSLVTAAAKAVNLYLDRELTPITSSATRRFYLEPYDIGYRVEFGWCDCTSVTSVVLNPEQTAPVTLLGPGNTLVEGSSLADFNLEPVNSRTGSYARLHISPFLPIFSVTALRLGQPMVDVTGSWGVYSTSTIPNDVRQAAILTVRSWLRDNPASYAFADVEREPGHIAPAIPATFGIPPGACRLLAAYRRWSI